MYMTDGEKLDLILSEMRGMKSEMQDMTSEIGEIRQKTANCLHLYLVPCISHFLFFPAYNIENLPTGLLMKSNCANLYFLSTIACQLVECLDEKELEMLSADLTTLGYMIESLLAHQSVCKDD